MKHQWWFISVIDPTLKKKTCDGENNKRSICDPFIVKKKNNKSSEFSKYLRQIILFTQNTQITHTIYNIDRHSKRFNLIAHTHTHIYKTMANKSLSKHVKCM